MRNILFTIFVEIFVPNAFLCLSFFINLRSLFKSLILTMAHIRFNIQYKTNWGEILCLDYKIKEGEVSTLAFHTTDGYDWWAEMEIPAAVGTLVYGYCIMDNQGNRIRRESGLDRSITFGFRSHLLLCDRWELEDRSAVLSRSAFTDCIYRRKGGAAAQMELLSASYLLLMRAVPPMEGWRWGITGSSESLGCWDAKKVKFLQRTDVYEWGLILSSTDFIEGLEYKYVLINENNPDEVIWEEGENRKIRPYGLEKNESAIQTDNTPLVHLQPWRGAGVVIPVFSLRSKGSFGVGDFGDLKRFIAWAADVGLKAVQLLPINDTTATYSWRDSYPYNGISVFALHPIYLDLREWEHLDLYQAFVAQGYELNALPALDYTQVIQGKMAFLRAFYKEYGDTVMKHPGYQQYVYENQHWLDDYARFSVLRDLNQSANFQDWTITADQVGDVLEEKADFYRLVQYLLHRQMSAVHEYARQVGVILKGDIPIGVNRDSVPAWVNGELFHFDGQAGAPPDAFAVNGQNWGFPTYNWEKMSEDGYQWWRARLAHMGKYFDAYRIDHVLGFFRIWEIPSEQIYGILGRFNPALPYSIEELHSFGFTADVERYTRAFVYTPYLKQLEQKPACAGIRLYFQEVSSGVWELRPEYATQRALCAAVPEGPCRDALLDVVSQVLFIRDGKDVHRFHPRIGGRDTLAYQTLSDEHKRAFDALHDHFFYVRHNEFWADEAMKKIPAVINYGEEEHSMLPCAEDLGMVPASVKGVLDHLHILSLEIQRMPKVFGLRFAQLQQNPYLSVATIATHDMPPLRLWWRENQEQTQAFWHDVLGRAGEAPAEAEAEVCEQVVAMHLESPSMLCLLALQDWLAIDATLRNPHPENEQINVPSNPNQYWQYRMHLTLEDLVQATSFNEKLRALVARSGR